MEFWNQKTFCLITGASRGIGKSIAIEFSKKFKPDSVFVLLARTGLALEQTKEEINSINSCVHVINAVIDLSKPNAAEYFNLINSALETSRQQAGNFEHCILVHNAASVGDIHLCVTEMEDLAQLREYFDCNLFSLILLTSQFFKVFPDSSMQRSIVHISSQSALDIGKNLGQYSAGKAARDMVIRSIAAEEPSISTISYDPGPVDTQMYNYIEHNADDEELRKSLQSIRTSKAFKTTLECVTELIKVLGERKYTKGEHVPNTSVL